MANLLQLMEESGLNRNQISKISGISNTFLAKIERTEKGGRRTDIRRKTLINIAVSLNLNLEEIDSLLIEYGHAEVSPSDTPYFLAASENQAVTGILPLFSSLALEWFLIGMEKSLASIAVLPWITFWTAAVSLAEVQLVINSMTCVMTLSNPSRPPFTKGRRNIAPFKEGGRRGHFSGRSFKYEIKYVTEGVKCSTKR